ncbi:MAG: hypothetical protein ACF8SC_04890 [Phycisphaerales bacterium JB037]
MTSLSNSTRTGDDAFPVHARRAIGAIRDSAAALLESLPAVITKPVDLQRVLRLDAKLAWQIHKLATADEPLEVGRLTPGTGSFRTFVRSVQQAGVPEDAITRFEQAVREFSEMVRLHAGDRQTFDSMISAFESGAQAEQSHLEHRRAAFRANRHIWGGSVRAWFATMILAHDEDAPDRVDLVSLTGLVDIKRLRTGAIIPIRAFGNLHDDGKPNLQHRPEALAPPPEGLPRDLALIPDFCAGQMPDLSFKRLSDDLSVVEISGDTVGLQSSTTVVQGFLARRVASRFRSPSDTQGGFIMTMRSPCEVLICDLLVADRTMGRIKPAARTYAANLHQAFTIPAPPEAVLMPGPEMRSLGSNLDTLRTPSVPRYAELIRFAIERAGWADDTFHAYRATIEYPVMPSATHVLFELPEPP